MKIKHFILASLVLSSLCFGSAALAQNNDISVLVDNEAVTFDQPPVIQNDRTLVPIRAVFEKAGATVDWNGDTHTAIITGKGHVVQIGVGNSYMFKDGKSIPLDVPATVINDRTLIPVRAISEAMDFGVTWNGYKKTVLIATDNKPYRAFVGINRGFRSLTDIAEYYIDGECTNLEVDIDGNGTNEAIDFMSTLSIPNANYSVLSINGIDYTGDLATKMDSIGAIAVVKVTDNKKLFVIVENADVKVAHFYTFDGMTLSPIKDANGKDASIIYKKDIFFDEVKFAISDLYGICCTDIMITGSYFDFSGENMGFFRLSTVKDIIPVNLNVVYNDDMLFRLISTKDYKEGVYGSIETFDLINSSQLTSFTLLDIYVDKTDPSYIEFFVETPQGERFVLMPYCV